MTRWMLLVLVSAPASAVAAQDVEHSLGLGMQSLTLIEHDRNTGDQLVREHGSIPSLTYGLRWPYRQARFNMLFRQAFGDIDYDGRTQSGLPHKTESNYTISEYSNSVGLMVTHSTEVFAGFDMLHTIRNVANRGNVYGATETYNETLAHVGLRQTLMEGKRQQLWLWGQWQHPLRAHSNVDLRVNFDDTALTLKEGSGQKFGLHYQYYWRDRRAWFIDVAHTTRRYDLSTEATLTRNGQPTGSYAYQPPIEFRQLNVSGGVSWHWR